MVAKTSRASHPVAQHLGNPDQGDGEVDRTEEEHPGRGGEGLYEHPQGLLAGLAVIAVVPEAATAGSQLAQSVSCHDPVQVIVAEGALDLHLVDRWAMDHELGAGTRAIQNRGQRHRNLIAQQCRQTVEDRGLGQGPGPRLPVQRFDEEVDGATTRQAHGERLIIAVAERHHAPVARGEHVEGLHDHGPLDAASGNRAGYLAVLGDGHRCTRETGPGTLQVHHARYRNTLPLAAPALEVFQDLPHRPQARGRPLP
mgnify:CR=1 FL=1